MCLDVRMLHHPIWPCSLMLLEISLVLILFMYFYTLFDRDLDLLIMWSGSTSALQEQWWEMMSWYSILTLPTATVPQQLELTQ